MRVRPLLRSPERAGLGFAPDLGRGCQCLPVQFAQRRTFQPGHAQGGQRGRVHGIQRPHLRPLEMRAEGHGVGLFTKYTHTASRRRRL